MSRQEDVARRGARVAFGVLHARRRAGQRAATRWWSARTDGFSSAFTVAVMSFAVAVGTLLRPAGRATVGWLLLTVLLLAALVGDDAIIDHRMHHGRRRGSALSRLLTAWPVWWRSSPSWSGLRLQGFDRDRRPDSLLAWLAVQVPRYRRADDERRRSSSNGLNSRLPSSRGVLFLAVMTDDSGSGPEPRGQRRHQPVGLRCSRSARAAAEHAVRHRQDHQRPLGRGASVARRRSPAAAAHPGAAVQVRVGVAVATLVRCAVRPPRGARTAGWRSPPNRP